ncbi:hypothetical protein [Peribacillus alkalitolerans]|uniref:hypothetical protein n=1 Tax=Peribacillus alkalitolerans TaxID=1550385 RepID=UPI0013D3ECF9|nr:hypothetical protein [Peribacillus alkalitolerans]
MKNTKLRVVWIIPNVICYIMFVGFSTLIALNVNGLQEIKRLDLWVFAMIILFFISIFGSYRILSWIKKGKM